MLFGTAGRIRRRDYWVWMIGKTIVLAILFVPVVMALSQVPVDSDHRTYLEVCAMWVFIALYAGMNICLTTKRWHDRNRSGWMWLILFIPYVGWAWTVIECGFIDGTQGRNKYGKSPKGISYSTVDMKFRDLVVFKKHWFALGIETHSGQHYLSIPVSNQVISYEEYYRLDKDQFEAFKANVDLGMAFADKCRNREMDHLLILPPAMDRGVA